MIGSSLHQAWAFVCGARPARGLRATAAASLSAFCASLWPAPALAQDDAEAQVFDADEPAEESEQAEQEQDPEEAPSEPAAEPPSPRSTFKIAEEHRTEAATYRLPDERIWAAPEWDGGRMHGQIELDVGYATYRYPHLQDRPEETLHDIRGRFVLGPTFRHDFASSDYFLKVTAQFVAWVLEQANEYQINTDDVYVQVGNAKWDLQIGRFMTWRVYHKGLGFDLYTLEDNGASEAYPISNGTFAVHTYEVDYIFLRNSPYVNGEIAGRAAFHYYPLDVLGFELAAAYGLTDNRGTNTLGGRLASDLQWKFLRLSAAGEYRRQVQTSPLNVVQNPGTPMERTVECPDCGASKNYGFGGGLTLRFSPVTLGGNAAVGWDEQRLGTGDENGNPEPDDANSGRRFSFGGYFELDVGSWLFERSLILGVGSNRTELVLDSFDKDFHLQSAVYAAYPLGLNNAMLKLVVSQAQADLYDSTDTEGSAYIDIHPESTAVRLRFSTDF